MITYFVTVLHSLISAHWSKQIGIKLAIKVLLLVLLDKLR